MRRGLAFGPNGRRIVAGGSTLLGKIRERRGDLAIRMWDTQSGQELPLPEIRNGHSGTRCSAIAFRPVGEQLATNDLGIIIRDAHTGREIHWLGLGHLREDLGVVYVAYNPDGTRLFTYDGDTLMIRDAETGHEAVTIKIERTDPILKQIFAGHWDGSVLLRGRVRIPPVE